MSESRARKAPSRRRTAIIAGSISTIALVAALGGTMSALSASITNSVNTGGIGSLVMKETGPDSGGKQVECTTSASNMAQTCATINKYGGNLAMTTTGANSSKTTTITISNPGTISAATFTLAAGACTLTNPQSSTGDLCKQAKVTVTQDSNTIVNGVAPADMASKSYTLTPVAAGASSSIVVTFSTAQADNTVMGESVSQPLTWTFNA